jgi:hypothetical protein
MEARVRRCEQTLSGRFALVSRAHNVRMLEAEVKSSVPSINHQVVAVSTEFIDHAAKDAVKERPFADAHHPT